MTAHATKPYNSGARLRESAGGGGGNGAKGDVGDVGSSSLRRRDLSVTTMIDFSDLIPL